MGAIVRISCESCGTEWSCRTGCGIHHGVLKNVAPLFPDDIRNTLMEYAERSECPMFDFGFQPAVCENCVGIISIPVLRIHDGNISYTGVCPDCGKKAHLIKDILKAQCPVCGRNALKTSKTGFWD